MAGGWCEVPRLAGIPLCTCASEICADNIYICGAQAAAWGVCLENTHCLRCNRELQPGQKSVALYMFAQTVGVKPRQKSAAHRISFCPQCCVSLAMGPPPEGALNTTAWEMIRDLVASDPSLNRAAWESLSGVLGLLPATGTEGGSRPSQGGGYFEF
jgi:hypothetical protein